MINKKISELFMRKENTKKQQQKQILSFDENFFHCRLISRGINTELIRVQSQVKQNGQPLDQIKCKWFIKNTHDFKEIQDVTSQYYQPCLDDVGSIICVQVEPFIQGRKYNGIIIMKQSEPIQIDVKLEQELNKFLQTKKLKFDGRLEAVFSQNEKYQEFELPSQIKLQIVDNDIHFYQNGNQFQLIKINSEYPNIEFIRKSFNSIILNFNERESYKLSFNNNFQRDLFTLITRTLSAHSTESINPEKQSQSVEEIQVKNQKQPQVQQATIEEYIQQKKNDQNTEQHNKSSEQQTQSIKSCQKIQVKSAQKLQILRKSSQKLQVVDEPQSKQKIEEPKQNNTMLILKLDEQGKELKLVKRQLDELRVNYNIQKQSKRFLEIENEQFKKNIAQLKKKLQQAQTINKKMAQVSQDNRFYKNEISIIRKQLKASKEKVKQLEAKIQIKNALQQNDHTIKMKALIEQNEVIKKQKQIVIKSKENMENQLQRAKNECEKMENENHLLRKKLQSLQSQRNLPQPKQFQTQTTKSQSESEKRVVELEMKLKNLEMLLRYKSNQGDPSSNFQLLVNKLTQTISEKEIQLNEYKKINKNLTQQLKQLKEKPQ